MSTPLDRMKAELELEDALERGEVFFETFDGKRCYYTVKQIGKFVSVKQQVNIESIIGAAS